MPALVGVPPASAQTAKTYFILAADGAKLTVPATLALEPSTSTSLRILTPPAAELPPNSFVRLRGLPPAVALSEGYAIAAGVWAVPLASLANLRIVVPVGVTGSADVTVSLVAVDDAAIAEAKIALTIKEQGGAGRAPSATAPRAPKAALSPEARERAQKLVQRGEQELANGNVAQARGFFMRAADAGLAHGAIMLGTTYDPGELTRLKVQGVQPNAAEARKWYEKARELGAPEANARLVSLGGQ
ncbi:MAG: hypothetical protein NW223_17945 [Hyphomicrobiaceae bacterium]|nr:hypothetical protein [Hyphomicrobiaceae bacterium]